MSKRGYGSWALPAAGAIAAGRNFYNAAKRARTGAKRSTRGRTRARGRGPPIRTRTKVSLHQSAKQSGHAGSFSNFYYGKRQCPKKVYNAYKGVAAQIYQTNVAGVLTCTSGVQNQTIVNSLYCGSDVYETTGVQADLEYIFNAIGTWNGGNATRRTLLETVSGETMLQNQCNVNVRVILYDIICRRDLDSQTAISWGPTNPTVAWDTGYQDAGATLANAKNLGSTPFQSPLFTDYFKVLKATHILMAPGQTHVHRIKFSPNKLLHGEVHKYSNANHKGLTCYQMMVISGCPCDNNSTTVSTADAKIDYVSKKVYRFKNIVDDSIKLTATNNITAITAATENIMNVDTGAATTFGSV